MALMRVPVAVAAAAVALLMMAPAPATAACFEYGVGCTNDVIPYPTLRRLSCDWLWTVRNTIFYENGYCFHTARGRAVFSNRGCAYDDSGSVPLSRVERENVNRILSVERRKGCR